MYSPLVGAITKIITYSLPGDNKNSLTLMFFVREFFLYRGLLNHKAETLCQDFAGLQAGSEDARKDQPGKRGFCGQTENNIDAFTVKIIFPFTNFFVL